MSISVTKNAWSKMNRILKISKHKIGFLYTATSGGCNGFNFTLGLIDSKRHEDIIRSKYHTVLKHDDTYLYVDPSSEMYLLGTTIDYIQEDIANGQFENKFVFDGDKDLMTSCGCGISFSPKII
jgi:iron-sulfur cluster assembly accessory protein